MTTDAAINYWTHPSGDGDVAHEWRYLGKKAQMYHCVVCQLRVSKAALKEHTDA